MTFTPKAATIGGTISFNDRDSFSFQISGEIASAEDYIGLAAFAGGALLGQFRDADPETLRTVRQFVSRFSSVPEEDLPVVPPTRGSAPEPTPNAPPEPETSAPAGAPSAPQSAKPAPVDGEICEKCGAAVTKSQAKLSHLFQGKTLCKKCMDSPEGSA